MPIRSDEYGVMYYIRSDKPAGHTNVAIDAGFLILYFNICPQNQ